MNQPPDKSDPPPARELFWDITDEGEAAIALWNTVFGDYFPIVAPLRGNPDSAMRC